MIKEVAHTVLYRKHRPTNWDEVVGQDKVVDLIKNSILTKKPSHAYLFTGGRGLGKTTVARILAKSLDVKSGDIYEIDAASKRGIDDIRDLRDHIRSSPIESPYKVYIIDEVHMLTKEAFNALLKTLEEPPAYVVFILATTEIDKVPDTVRSRTQVLNFVHPTKDVLEKYISKIAEKEKFKITTEAVKLLAELADKSYRDACGRLEEAHIHSLENKGEEITAEIVAESFGVPNPKIVQDLLQAIVFCENTFAQNVLQDKNYDTLNHEVLMRLLLTRIRIVHMIKHKLVSKSQIIDLLGEEETVFLEKIANDSNNKLTSATIIKILDTFQMIKHSPIKSLPLEILLTSL